MSSMSIVELKKCVELCFNGSEEIPKGLDNRVLVHANDYFLTAAEIYDSLGDKDFDYSPVYPILTLLGLSAELFLKGFHIEIIGEEYIDDDDKRSNAYSSLGKDKGFLLSKGIVKTHNKPSKNGHDLGALLEYHRTYNKYLYDYLVSSYHRDTERHLDKDLTHYSDIFKQTRYIYEKEESLNKSYHSELSIIFLLVRSLYNSINSLYKD